MRSRRRNTDEDLRALEREAATGDPAAVARLIVARARTGQIGRTTLDQLAALPSHDDLATALRATTEKFRSDVRSVLSDMATPALPPMTYDEIIQVFNDHNYGSSLRDFEDAVGAEAEALAAHARRGTRRRISSNQFTPQARNVLAEAVSDFLSRPSVALEPHEIFGNRIRPAAWATSVRLRELLVPQTTELPPGPRVSAEAHSDDLNVEIPFDATAWFEQASDDEIVNLADIGWRGGYESDAVAEHFSNGVTRALAEYVAATGSGFECSVDGNEARAWIAVNRPALVDRLPPADD